MNIRKAPVTPEVMPKSFKLWGKAGKFNNAAIEGAIYGILLLIVLFKLFASLIPQGQAAGNELNSSGVPFGSLFAADGIVWLIVMIGLLVLVIKHVMGKGGK